MAASLPLGRRARWTLLLLGLVLIAAALCYGFFFFVNVVVGLVEPVHPSGLGWTLIASEALFAFLLLATGMVGLTCRTRRGLRVLAALAAAAAAAFGVSLILYPRVIRAACAEYVAAQSEIGAIDPADVADCVAGSS
jgi:hypothetical protein